MTDNDVPYLLIQGDQMSDLGYDRGQRTRTIIIAAPDASPEMRAVADYLTTGSGDSAIFAAAVDALPSGGVLYPCGTFDFTEETNLALTEENNDGGEVKQDVSER